MFEADKLVPFVSVALSLIATPGPAKLLLLSTSASRGFKAGTRLALGIFVSDAIHVTVVAIGLGALIVSNRGIRAAIGITGAAFLVYFALIYVRKAMQGPPAAVSARGSENYRDLAVVGLLLNLFNPLAIAFYVGLLPQFAEVTSSVPVPVQLGVYGGVLVTAFLTVHIVLAFVATRFNSTNVAQIWFRVSYAVAAAVLLWLCFRMLLGIFGTS